MATIGLGQRRKGWVELPIVTAGDDINSLEEFIAPGEKTYSATDVIERLLAKPSLA
jgi:nitronate monooxygenase